MTSLTTSALTVFFRNAHASDNELKQKLFMLRGMPSVAAAMES